MYKAKASVSLLNNWLLCPVFPIVIVVIAFRSSVFYSFFPMLLPALCILTVVILKLGLTLCDVKREKDAA